MLRTLLAASLGLLAPALDLHEEMPAWISSLAARQQVGPAELQEPSAWGSDRWPFADVWEAAEHVMAEDPVAFAEVCFVVRNALNEPPLRLWPYQQAALRYRGDLILQCAPETGKTMCAGIVALHRFLFFPGDVLVAGAFGAHAREIFRELEFQLSANPWLKDLVDWDKVKSKPYPEIGLKASGRLMHFRPVGTDGTALRGLHVTTVLVDESVKIKGTHAREAWANINSRLLPGGLRWYLSTPDGQRLTPFIDLCIKTPEVPPLALPATPREGLCKLVWSKRLQPAPFFTPERLAQWIEDYGGESSPEFLRNVDGEIGQPTRAVFDYALLDTIATYIPGYERFRLEQKGTDVELSRWRLRPGGDALDTMDDDQAEEMVLELLDRRRLRNAAIIDPDVCQEDKVEAWLELLEPLIPALEGDLVAGIDAGKVIDPFEILVGRVRGVSGDVVEWVLRLQLLQLDYRAQDALVRALDHILQPRYGWGLDATSGPAITEYLEAHCQVRGKRARPRVGKYLMNVKIDRMDSAGRPMLVAGDKEGRAVERWTYKAQGVSILETAARAGNRRLPYDPEILRELAAYEEFPGRQYTKKNDHVIAAAIVLELRLFDVTVAHWTTSKPAPPPPPLEVQNRRKTTAITLDEARPQPTARRSAMLETLGKRRAARQKGEI